MKTVVFEYEKGWNDIEKEEMEYENDATDEEIQEDFEEWIWNIIGDRCNWYEK